MRDVSLSWQKILAQGFSSAQELLWYLQLPTILGSAGAEQQFKLRVPRGFAARMQPGNAKDPLLLQVLASPEEMRATEHFVPDPLSEGMTNPVPGLLHKYHGRVLITLTGACAVHCRYCFRRHFPYHENNPGVDEWRAILAYIRDNPSIQEVILSGGDPLLATDGLLSRFLMHVERITHVRTIRFHTRIPIVLPERITPPFLQVLRQSRLRKVMVLHSNHAQELNESVKLACQGLQEAGCQLLNQTVLLKGVNAEVEVLVELSERLFDYGILPYYLHRLDKVKGAAHFDLSLDKILSLYHQLQARLPGYLLPRLAQEEPGKLSKTLLV